MSFWYGLLLFHFIGIWVCSAFTGAYILFKNRRFIANVPQDLYSLWILFVIILIFSFCWEIIFPVFLYHNRKYFPVKYFPLGVIIQKEK